MTVEQLAEDLSWHQTRRDTLVGGICACLKPQGKRCSPFVLYIYIERAKCSSGVSNIHVDFYPFLVEVNGGSGTVELLKAGYDLPVSRKVFQILLQLPTYSGCRCMRKETRQ